VLYEKSKTMQIVGIDDGREALQALGVESLVQGELAAKLNKMLEGWL
jgi:hypothetical protein